MPSDRLPVVRVAVIGAGLAGATCARVLADGGAAVQVFDKSRGVGGRMATRRAEWAAARPIVGDLSSVAASDAEPLSGRASFDHGVAAFTARSPAFRQAVEQAQRDGLLARWSPRLAPGLAALAEPWWVARPDMPAWCRSLLQGVELQTGAAVEALEQDAFGWSLRGGDSTIAGGFDAVVVAIPPEQAAALLAPHGLGAAVDRRRLQPCWALMAVSDESSGTAGWDLACPTTGPIASIFRNDAKPGRDGVPGLAHWLVHATAAWSQQHLEDPAEQVRAALMTALDEALHAACAHGPPAAPGLRPPRTWHHAVVHRWRYATSAGTPAAPALCAWDPALGLGACGDALGGGGVEGAWRSGQALARLIQRPGPGSQARIPGDSPSLASFKRYS